ncbi:MAG: DUF58 domain-containing protein [Myxococcales bacterium]|nr:DUF58 domain-containing protein [Myxococcales bacterium]
MGSLRDVFPVTILGLLMASAGALGVVFLGYGQQDMVVLVVGYAALYLGLVSVLGVLVAFVGLRRSLRGDVGAMHAQLETGRWVSTGFRLRRFRWVPFARVRWEWLEPGPASVLGDRSRGTRGVEERVRLTDRGAHRIIVRRFWVEDVLGLARIAKTHAMDHELVVLPHRGALGSLPPLVSMATGDWWSHPMGLADGDRIDTRRYAPGDPARFIHWKIFGRTRKLLVRVPERALSHATRTAAFLVAGPGDGASAAAARVVAERSLPSSDWIFGADGAEEPTGGLEAALGAIVRSVEARDRGAVGLQAFLRSVDRQGPTSLVLFVPPEPGPWLERVTATLRRRGGPVRIIVGIDGLSPSPHQRGVRRLLVQPSDRPGTARDQLNRVLAALSGLRADILVVDRISGRAWNAGRGVTLPEELAA